VGGCSSWQFFWGGGQLLTRGRLRRPGRAGGETAGSAVHAAAAPMRLRSVRLEIHAAAAARWVPANPVPPLPPSPARRGGAQAVAPGAALWPGCALARLLLWRVGCPAQPGLLLWRGGGARPWAHSQGPCGRAAGGHTHLYSYTVPGVSCSVMDHRSPSLHCKSTPWFTSQPPAGRRAGGGGGGGV
jgi:hypothetical protein